MEKNPLVIDGARRRSSSLSSLLNFSTRRNSFDEKSIHSLLSTSAKGWPGEVGDTPPGKGWPGEMGDNPPGKGWQGEVGDTPPGKGWPGEMDESVPARRWPGDKNDTPPGRGCQGRGSDTLPSMSRGWQEEETDHRGREGAVKGSGGQRGGGGGGIGGGGGAAPRGLAFSVYDADSSGASSPSGVDLLRGTALTSSTPTVNRIDLRNEGAKSRRKGSMNHHGQTKH